MHSAITNRGAPDAYWALRGEEDLIALLSYHTASSKLEV